MPRPKKPRELRKSEIVPIPFSIAEWEALDNLSKELGVSKAEIVRNCLRKCYPEKFKNAPVEFENTLLK